MHGPLSRLVLPLLLMPLLASAASLDAPLLERVRVARVRLPVQFRPGAPGACDELSVGEIRLRVRGEARRVTAVERARPPTLHALLLDTSGSTDPWLASSDRAIASYLAGLPREDQVLQATFDADLRLLRPPTPVGELEPAPATGTEAAQGDLPRLTALWDALDGLVRAVAVAPEERRVLVLLTDGCDSLSLPDNHPDAVIARAAGVPGLSIFPVVLGRKTTCASPGRSLPGLTMAPRNALERLARATSGWLVPLETTRSVRAAFDAILARLDQEGIVVYEEPEPVPRSSRPTGGKRGGGVELRTARGGRCRLRPAAPAGRSLRLDPPATAGLPWRGGRGLAGEVEDLVRERGPLYREGSARPGGRFTVQEDRPARRERRRVRIVSRPYDDLLARPGPEAAVLWWLQAGGEAWPRDAAVQGQVFLEIAPALSRALADEPGYREWVRERVQGARQRELGELLADEKVDPLSPAGRAVARVILSRPPADHEVTPRLAAWLGDLSAAELAAGLDRLAAGAVLAAPWDEAGPGADPAGSRPPEATAVAAAWPALRAAFPPPEAIRVRVPLVPAFDAGRGAVGFYRVRLPEPRPGRPPQGLIPGQPPALAAAEWLRDTGWRAPAGGAIRLVSVVYRELTGAEERDLRDWLYGAGRGGWRGRDKDWLAAELRLMSDSGQQALLNVFWSPAAGVLCAGLPGPRREADHPLAASLRDLLLGRGSLCASGP